jgi:hypothetical protein
MSRDKGKRNTKRAFLERNVCHFVSDREPKISSLRYMAILIELRRKDYRKMRCACNHQDEEEEVEEEEKEEQKEEAKK